MRHQLQQYLSMQVSHTPPRSSPARALERSTTAHAKHAGHAGSFIPATGMPCVATSNVWASIASSASAAYANWSVDVFVSGAWPSGAPPFARYTTSGAPADSALPHPKKAGRVVRLSARKVDWLVGTGGKAYVPGKKETRSCVA